MKTCITCKAEKPLTEFYHSWDSRRKKKYPHSNCIICDKARNIKYHHANRNKVTVRQVASHRRRKYGISEQEYNQMVLDQNNLCAICNKPSEKTLSVDHDHKTGKVRGLLCSNCNFAIGLFDDKVTLLNSAIAYLTFPPK